MIETALPPTPSLLRLVRWALVGEPAFFVPQDASIVASLVSRTFHVIHLHTAWGQLVGRARLAELLGVSLSTDGLLWRHDSAFGGCWVLESSTDPRGFRILCEDTADRPPNMQEGDLVVVPGIRAIGREKHAEALAHALGVLDPELIEARAIAALSCCPRFHTGGPGCQAPRHGFVSYSELGQRGGERVRELIELGKKSERPDYGGHAPGSPCMCGQGALLWFEDAILVCSASCGVQIDQRGRQFCPACKRWPERWVGGTDADPRPDCLLCGAPQPGWSTSSPTLWRCSACKKQDVLVENGRLQEHDDPVTQARCRGSGRWPPDAAKPA